MRLISFSLGGAEGVGLWTSEGYRGLPVATLGADLKDHLAHPATLSRLAKMLAAAPLLDPAAITLLPPVPRPDKILCVGLNYADHSAESGFTPPDYPTVFARFATSLVGAGAPLVRPNASEMFDYEAELVVVIGRGGRHIAKVDALAHVAGYSLGNDGSVRDYQKKSPQWTMDADRDAVRGDDAGAGRRHLLGHARRRRAGAHPAALVAARGRVRGRAGAAGAAGEPGRPGRRVSG
jgi:acylpyruvate hydrolase